MGIPKKKPRSAKRFTYKAIGQVTLGNEMDEAQLTNISASGIQFETHNSIRLNTKVQLLWKDNDLGMLGPNMFVIREIHRPEREQFRYIYGAQYHNLDSDLKEKLIQLLKKLKKMEILDALDKAQDASPEYLLQTIESGLDFLKKYLQDPQVQFPVLAKAGESLAEYEKNAFQLNNEIAAHIQKYSCQTFQCRALTYLAPIILKFPDFKSRYLKTITSVLKNNRETENVRILLLFQNFQGLDQQKKELLKRIEESKNRTFYAKQDLLQIVYETFEVSNNQPLEQNESLKVITSEYEETLEVTNRSGFDLSNWVSVKKNTPPKILVDEFIIDNRPPPDSSSMSNSILILISLSLILVLVLLYR